MLILQGPNVVCLERDSPGYVYLPGLRGRESTSSCRPNCPPTRIQLIGNYCSAQKRYGEDMWRGFVLEDAIGLL